MIRFRFVLPSVMGNTLPNAVVAAQHYSILTMTDETQAIIRAVYTELSMKY
jgi:hypothetical protein